MLILSQLENIYHELVIPAEAGIQRSYYKIFLNLKYLSRICHSRRSGNPGGFLLILSQLENIYHKFVIPTEAGIQGEFLLILSQFENIYHELVIPAEAGSQGELLQNFSKLKIFITNLSFPRKRESRRSYYIIFLNLKY